MRKIYTIERLNLKNSNYQERITQVIGKQPKERDVDGIADVLRLLIKKGDLPKGGCL